MAQRVVERVQTGAIILAHDSRPYERLSREKTMEALASVVAELVRQGYRFVTVPELLALPPQKPPVARNSKS